MNKKSLCCYCFNEIEFERRKKPKTCPICNMGYWSKPPTEEKCFLYQRDYISNLGRNEEQANLAIGNLYYLLQEYAIGMVKKMLRGKKILPEDTLLEYGADAAFIFIKKFLEEKEPKFMITNSFGGQLKFILLPILHGQKVINQDSVLSLNSHIDFEDNKEKLELNNFSNVFNTSIDNEFFLQKTKEEDAIVFFTKIIGVVLKDIYKRYDVYTGINFLAGIHHRINNAHLDFMDRFYETHGGVVVQSIVESTMAAIKKFIEQET